MSDYSSEFDEDIGEDDFFKIGKRKRQKPSALDIFETDVTEIQDAVPSKTKKGIIAA